MRHMKFILPVLACAPQLGCDGRYALSRSGSGGKPIAGNHLYTGRSRPAPYGYWRLERNVSTKPLEKGWTWAGARVRAPHRAMD